MRRIGHAFARRVRVGTLLARTGYVIAGDQIRTGDVQLGKLAFYH
jgi:hypothetical protein